MSNTIKLSFNSYVLLNLLFPLFLALHASPARAELYKWTDSAGRDNYVDDLAKVPHEYRGQATDLQPAAPQFTVQSRTAGSDAVEERGQTSRDHSGKGETWWRNQADNLRRQIKQKQEELDNYYASQKDCAEAQKNIISSRNRDCGSLHAENIKRLQTDVERLQRKLESDLPDEARKAGASPGWLRESGDSPVQAHAGGGRDEAWWRNQARNAREDLSREQSNLDNYIEQEAKCEEEQRYNTGCRKKNCKVMYESRKKNAQRRIDKLKQKLEVELPEEARRTGAYPGWLR